MGKQEIGTTSRRVGVYEISLQNLYVDTGALTAKHLYISYSCQHDGFTCGVAYMLLWPKGCFA